jgi:hypothetical protein
MEKRSVDYERRIISFANIPDVLAGAGLTQAGAKAQSPRKLEVAFLVENRPCRRANLLASAIARTLWCSRFLAASIHAASR